MIEPSKQWLVKWNPTTNDAVFAVVDGIGSSKVEFTQAMSESLIRQTVSLRLAMTQSLVHTSSVFCLFEVDKRLNLCRVINSPGQGEIRLINMNHDIITMTSSQFEAFLIAVKQRLPARKELNFERLNKCSKC